MYLHRPNPICSCHVPCKLCSQSTTPHTEWETILPQNVLCLPPETISQTPNHNLRRDPALPSSPLANIQTSYPNTLLFSYWKNSPFMEERQLPPTPRYLTYKVDAPRPLPGMYQCIWWKQIPGVQWYILQYPFLFFFSLFSPFPNTIEEHSHALHFHKQLLYFFFFFNILRAENMPNGNHSRQLSCQTMYKKNIILRCPFPVGSIKYDIYI